MKRTALKRTAAPVRRSGLRPRSRKQARSDARYSRHDRPYVIERDGGVCQVCGGPGTDVHHRAGRGVNLHRRDLMVLVCRGCHVRIESERAWAYSEGWLVRRNGMSL